MKRFLGYILAGTGAIGSILGAYHVATGNSMKHIQGIPAMYLGLGGLALLVLGLVMARD